MNVSTIMNACGEEITIDCNWRPHTMEALHYLLSGTDEDQFCFLTQGQRQTDCSGMSRDLVADSRVKAPPCTNGNWPMPGKLGKAQQFVATEIGIKFWAHQIVADPADPAKFCIGGSDPDLPAFGSANALGLQPTLQQLNQLHANLDYVLTLNGNVVSEGPLSEITGFGPGSTAALPSGEVGGFMQCCGNIQLGRALHFCDTDTVGFCLVTRCEQRLAFPSVGGVNNANTQIYNPDDAATLIAGVDVMRVDLFLHGLLLEGVNQ